MKLPKQERINHAINKTLELAGYIKQSFNGPEAIIQLGNAITHLKEVQKDLGDSMLKEISEDAFKIE